MSERDNESIFPFEILCIICGYHPNDAKKRIPNISLTNKKIFKLYHEGMLFVFEQNEIFKMLHSSICSNKRDEISFTQFHNIFIITRSLDHSFRKQRFFQCTTQRFIPCNSIKEINKIYLSHYSKAASHIDYANFIQNFVIKWHRLFSRILDLVKIGEIRLTSLNFDFDTKLYT